MLDKTKATIIRLPLFFVSVVQRSGQMIAISINAAVAKKKATKDKSCQYLWLALCTNIIGFS